MVSLLKHFRLASRLTWLVLTGRRADCAVDYDRASMDYDALFSQIMGVHGIEVLQHIRWKPGQRVLELGCGTGFLTVRIAHYLCGRGTILAVDKSAGMLTVAQNKLHKFNRLKTSLYHGDMMVFLRRQVDASVDVVVCGWAISYTKPTSLLKEVARILKPGGQVGIIETRADAMDILMRAFKHVILDDPFLLKRYIHLALPDSIAMLRKWFLQAGLEVRTLWDGAQVLPCRDADEALEWVQRSGAAAGFIDVFDRRRHEEILKLLREEICKLTSEQEEWELKHTFVAGVAKSPEV